MKDTSIGSLEQIDVHAISARLINLDEKFAPSAGFFRLQKTNGTPIRRLLPEELVGQERIERQFSASRSYRRDAMLYLSLARILSVCKKAKSQDTKKYINRWSHLYSIHSNNRLRIE